VLPLFSQLDAPQVSPRSELNPFNDVHWLFLWAFSPRIALDGRKIEASSWKLILVAIREFFFVIKS
jgi:hypothetical protein